MIDLVLLFFGFVLTFILPGLFTLQLFFQKFHTKLQFLVFGFGLSLIIAPIIGIVSKLLNFSFIFLLLIYLLITFVLNFRLKKELKFSNRIKNKKMFLSLVILYIVVFLPPLYFLMSSINGDLVSITPHTRETFVYLSHLNTIKHVFPPEVPSIAGIPSQRYWMSYFDMSLMFEFAKVNSVVVYKFWLFILGLSNLLIVYSFVHFIWGEKAAIFSTLFMIFSGSFILLITLPKLGEMNSLISFLKVVSDSLHLYDAGPFFFSVVLMVDPSYTVGLFTFFLTLYTFFLSIKDKRFLTFSLLSTFIGVFYHTFWIFISVVFILTYYFIRILQERNIRNNLFVPSLFLSSMFFGIFIILHGNVLTPFSQSALTPLSYSALSKANLLQVLTFHLTEVGIPIIFFAIILTKKKREEIDYLLLPASILLFIFLNLLKFTYTSNMYKLLFSFYIVSYLYGGLGLAWFVKKYKISNILLSALLLLAISATLIYSFGNVLAYLNEFDIIQLPFKTWDVWRISGDEYVAYQWINENTTKNSIIVSKPQAGMSISSVEVPLSERRAYLSDMNEANITFIDYKIVGQRKKEIENLYLNCVLSESFEQFGSVYLLYRLIEIETYGMNCNSTFEKVFENTRVSIFKIK